MGAPIRSIRLLLPLMGAALLLSAQEPGKGKGAAKAWVEHFNAPLDGKKWAVSEGNAPGYRPGLHLGFYEPDNVGVQDGCLVLGLWQEPGTVDGNPDGTYSFGSHVATKQKYGYGTYEWRMRMSSTATTPAGAGDPVSGSVSAGFIYVNNSETEIDFEFGAQQPDTLVMGNWRNTNPATGPFDEQSTFSAAPLEGISDGFHTFKFVWQAGSIAYFVDDVLQAVHTTNVPVAPAPFMINHWGTDNPFWGGLATYGVGRRFFVDWVKFTPLP